MNINEKFFRDFTAADFQREAAHMYLIASICHQTLQQKAEYLADYLQRKLGVLKERSTPYLYSAFSEPDGRRVCERITELLKIYHQSLFPLIDK